MNDTVKAHLTLLRPVFGISTDSLIAHIDGLNGSSMDSLRVDLNGFSESFRTYRDSHITFLVLKTFLFVNLRIMSCPRILPWFHSWCY